MQVHKSLTLSQYLQYPMNLRTTQPDVLANCIRLKRGEVGDGDNCYSVCSVRPMMSFCVARESVLKKAE